MADKKPRIEPDFMANLSGAPLNGHEGEPPVPVLKQGEKRKEKRGGAVPLVAGSGGQSGGGWFFRLFGLGGRSGLPVGRAAIGMGGAGVKLGLVPTLLNFLSSNGGLAALAVLLSAGAVWSLYKLGMYAMDDGQVSSREVLFARPDGERLSGSSDVEGRSDASGLSFFSAANKGALGGEGAKNEEAAEAKDAAKTEAEAEGNGAKAGEGAGDPGTKIAGVFNAGAKPRMVGASGFGASSGIGGGLAGGTGMSGGVGRGFLPSATGKARAMVGSKRASNLSARKLSPVRSSTALKQARFANQMSRAAKGMSATEAQSFGATQAFEGGADALGNPIGGSGAGSSPGAGTGGVGVGATPFEGPIFNDPGMTAPPSADKGKNKSPWQKMLVMGVALLFVAAIVIIIEGVLAQLGKIILPLEGIALMLMGVASAMAAASAAIGAMIAGQYGQVQQGMILTVGGGITSAAAVAAMAARPKVMPFISVMGGIAGIGAAIGSLLTVNKVPDQDQVPNQK